MSSKLRLTVACGDYELVQPLIKDEVQPTGIDLTILDDMDPATRHWRFFRNQEFDAAEVSSCSYIMSVSQGYQFKAIPVFLHRRFRHGFIFINANKGIEKPTDLIGKKIGCKIFTVSAIHWQRGILEHEYGVPHRSVDWYAELDEDIDFPFPPGLKVHRLPHNGSVEQMLLDGELDALLSPDLLPSLRNKDPRIRRLFPKYWEEEEKYYRKTGIFPIMHVLAIRPEIVEKYPWVPVNLYNAFDEAKAVAMRRMENPRLVPLAWYRRYWEEQEELLGPDPWEYGLTEQNRITLETYVGYFVEQGLIEERIPLDRLFLNVDQGRKRGAEYRDRI
jgi:4,5-dihydroxyphthalate decarboxylase